MNKKKHLKKIGKIVKEFIIEKKFNKNYLSIHNSVTYNIHTRVTIDCYDYFDNMTIGEKKVIERELNEKVRAYLEKNKIEDTIKINCNEHDYSINVSYEIKERISY